MTKFKNAIYITLSSLILLSLGWFANDYYKARLDKTHDLISFVKNKPLEKYQIENLSKITPPSVDIQIEKELESPDEFTSYLISFSFDPTLSGESEKKVTGLMNIPVSSDTNDKFPLVVLFRGYVDQKNYITGVGSKRVGEYFAENGYITISPDFLGYAGSDVEAENIFESRFQTYTTGLTLLASLGSIDNWNQEDVYIWGHSNGGQIAITTLEISGLDYPTALWAPVTKPFPYSILYYTDVSDDRGKLIRRELSKFESDYDVEAYSLQNYISNIKAPLQIHQGTMDDAVPIEWSLNFSKQLENNDLNVDLVIHTGADHNLNPLWNYSINQTLNFFESF